MAYFVSELQYPSEEQMKLFFKDVRGLIIAAYEEGRRRGEGKSGEDHIKVEPTPIPSSGMPMPNPGILLSLGEKLIILSVIVGAAVLSTLLISVVRN